MKLTSVLSIGLLIFWIIAAIANMWFDLISVALLVKITATVLLLIVLAMVVSLSMQKDDEDKK